MSQELFVAILVVKVTSELLASVIFKILFCSQPFILLILSNSIFMSKICKWHGSYLTVS